VRRGKGGKGSDASCGVPRGMPRSVERGSWSGGSMGCQRAIETKRWLIRTWNKFDSCREGVVFVVRNGNSQEDGCCLRSGCVV
jgi:hypothetical protein